MKGKFLFILLICLMYPKVVYAMDIAEAEQYLAENKIVVPADIKDLCEYYGYKNGLVPELLEAVIFRESSFIPTAVDSTGTCKGLMQVKSSAHSARMKRLGAEDLFDPEDNIAVGSDYLRELMEGNTLEVALMLYNGDSRAYEKGYVSSFAKKVIKIADSLETIRYDK